MDWRSLLHGDPVPWLLYQAPYAARMPSRVDASKWVTQQATTILKHAFGEAAA